MPIHLYSHWKDKAARKNSKNKQAKSKLNAINPKYSIRVSSIDIQNSRFSQHILNVAYALLSLSCIIR